MLSEEEKNEINEKIHPGEPQHMAVSEALKTVQKRTGWVSDEQVKDVASFLKMTPEEVDSIATFYNMIFRRPVGRHQILICDSVSCFVMEYKKIHDYLQKKLGVPLGGTTADNRFTWIPCACLGLCELAPAMMVDGEVFGNLTPEKVNKILENFK